MSDQSGNGAPALSLGEKRRGNGLGIAAIIVGLLGVFTIGFLFGPLGVIVSIIALAGRQIGLGLVGLVLSIIACVTSVPLMSLIGLGVLWTMY